MNKTIVAGDKLAEIGTEFLAEAAQIRERVVDTFEEGVDNAKAAAKRAYKRTHNAAEDWFDDAAHKVKRHPLESVGITLGVGLAFGLAIGWLAARKGRS